MRGSVEATEQRASGNAARPAILLVEDDRELSEMIEGALRDEGFDVHAVSDGAAALDALAGRPFHLVVLDLMLPIMSGTAVCSEIRAQSNIPVLIMSAKSRLPDVLWGLQQGADDYVVKPFDVRELVARVAVVLQRTGRPEGWTLRQEFRYGDLAVDFRERVAVIRGKRVRLSPTEARLLACLSSHPGALVGHRELIARVWGWDSIAEKRYLKLYISYLRKKLESDPRRPELLTSERGVGYRMNLATLEADRPGDGAGTASAVSGQASQP